MIPVAENYEIKPLTEEEETIIEEKIMEYANAIAPSFPYTEEEQMVFKTEDEGRKAIGGCVVNVHEWGRAVLAQLWVATTPWHCSSSSSEPFSTSSTVW